jgi:thiol-disulfide isomerase/thioredoxin
VEHFLKDQVYVIDFWATWCTPCAERIPRLTELQKRHAGKLTVIGLTSADDDTNTLPAVEAFVKAHDAAMDYAVAWDDKQKTQTAWLTAAGRDGIPCCFVVDGMGVLAWIGDPLFLDLVLEPVLKGPTRPEALQALVTSVDKRLKRLNQMAKTDPKKALVELTSVVNEVPSLADVAENDVFAALLEAGHLDDAWPLGARVVRGASARQDAVRLNEIAWAIVNPDAKLRARDLELALQAASKAVAITAAKDGNFLDTLARVWFWKGDLKKALELQKQAVAADPDRADLKRALKEYESPEAGK